MRGPRPRPASGTWGGYRAGEGGRPKTRKPKRGDPVVRPTCWLLTKGWRKHGGFAPVWV